MTKDTYDYYVCGLRERDIENMVSYAGTCPNCGEYDCNWAECLITEE